MGERDSGGYWEVMDYEEVPVGVDGRVWEGHSEVEPAQHLLEVQLPWLVSGPERFEIQVERRQLLERVPV